MSEDGAHGLTVIAFLGSVFSPYYAWNRRRGGGDPLNHCAFNVVLYGRGSRRWAMTERGAAQVARDASQLSIGRSAVRFDGASLILSIDEHCAPLPRRLRGEIRLHPAALHDRAFALDAPALHRWTPYAPCARIEVRLADPALKWDGEGYFDSNEGAQPLESAFADWTWSRASAGGSTIVLYDVNGRDASQSSLALKFDSAGAIDTLSAPPRAPLANSGWRIARHTRADAGQRARVVATLVDAPFYSRSLIETRLLGAPGRAIHESLDLNRFRAPWVQCLLPFRMPRIAH